MPRGYTADVWVVCSCTQQRLDREYLGRAWPELVDVHEITADEDLVGRLGQSVWATASWSVLSPHLRAAIIARRRRHPAWRVVCYRDVELPALMHADRTARTFADRDVERLDEDADLIVIRTGYATGKNNGIPEGIAHVVASRIDRPSRAVWVLDEPRRPLAKGYVGWSEGLAGMLDRLAHDVWGTP